MSGALAEIHRLISGARSDLEKAASLRAAAELEDAAAARRLRPRRLDRTKTPPGFEDPVPSVDGPCITYTSPTLWSAEETEEASIAVAWAEAQEIANPFIAEVLFEIVDEIFGGLRVDGCEYDATELASRLRLRAEELTRNRKDVTWETAT